MRKLATLNHFEPHITISKLHNHGGVPLPHPNVNKTHIMKEIQSPCLFRSWKQKD
jgi:hypothetical protein